MVQYFHSVKLDREACKGCTNCIKRCPTEAIRVREGKAVILEERCIDCGECIRICPNHAKSALTDPFTRLGDFAHRIALPAPSFYGQFRPETPPEAFLQALLKIGFDDVYEVPYAAEAVSQAIRRYMEEHRYRRPLISSACPAVVRLLQVRFPELLEQVIPVESPMEVAAYLAKDKASADLGLEKKKIGAFFISPCAAKVTAVKQPVGRAESNVDGAFAMAAVYGEVLKHLGRGSAKRPPRRIRAGGLGIGWGRAGGENVAIGKGSLLAVDGIHSVIAVLEEVEKGRLHDVDYLEAQACIGGCIGGPLAVENPFVARVRMKNLSEQSGQKGFQFSADELANWYDQGLLTMSKKVAARPVMQLDKDLQQAITMTGTLERTVGELPGLDCGSCGSPSCRTLAEDIVRGVAFETDCVFKLRDRVQVLAQEVLELARKVPPAMGQKGPNANQGQGGASGQSPPGAVDGSPSGGQGR
ncbi:MAG TPA: [Fe-Fe] hydrogenase large subunit C-terminal domain-containing protein [Bacillota bacterium]|jgi:iron only hydrogenase large subunit-like protein